MILVHNPNAAFPVKVKQCCSRISEEGDQLTPVPQSSQALGCIIWLSGSSAGDRQDCPCAEVLHWIRAQTGIWHRSLGDDRAWDDKGDQSSCSWFVLLLLQEQVVDATGNGIQRLCLLLSAVISVEAQPLHWKCQAVHKCSDLEFLSNSLMTGKGSCSDISAITELPIYRSWVFGTALLTLEAEPQQSST